MTLWLNFFAFEQDDDLTLRVGSSLDFMEFVRLRELAIGDGELDQKVETRDGGRTLKHRQPAKLWRGTYVV